LFPVSSPTLYCALSHLQLPKITPLDPSAVAPPSRPHCSSRLSPRKLFFFRHEQDRFCCVPGSRERYSPRLRRTRSLSHPTFPEMFIVAVEPNSTANFFGNLHPCGRLYEQPFDLESARMQHRVWSDGKEVVFLNDF
jgi:hypothetical protein